MKPNNLVPFHAKEPSIDEQDLNQIVRQRANQHNLEAEKAILGSILLSNDCFYEIHHIVESSDFFYPQHKKLFQCIVTLLEAGDDVDVITLIECSKKLGLSPKNPDKFFEWRVYVSELGDDIPAIYNVSYYAQIVRDCSDVRQSVEVAAKLIMNSDCVEDVNEFLDQSERDIFSIRDKRVRNSPRLESGKSVMRSVFAQIEENYHARQRGEINHIIGTKTGLRDVDEMTLGLQKKDLILLAGRPSMGKTALALRMFQGACEDDQGCGVMFSCEQSKESLVMRMVSADSQVEAKKIKTGLIDERHIPKLTQSASHIAKLNAHFDDTKSPTPWHIRSVCRRLKRKYGKLSIVLIDYLQLMSSGMNLDREREVDYIALALKSIAVEMDCPVMALSQLNRALERRPDKRPMMSDLRESGTLEQHADVIGFIYRDEVYFPDTDDAGIAELIFAKQREGAVGTVRLRFKRECTSFQDLAPENHY